MSVLEESSFHESEMSVVYSLASGRHKEYVEWFTRLCVPFAVLYRASQTGSSRVQNIQRHRMRTLIAMASSVVSILMFHELPTFIPSRFRLNSTLQERVRGTFSFLAFLLFLSGRTKEIRPEYVMTNSHPHELEANVERQTSGDFVSRFLLLDALASFSFTLFPFLDVEAKVKALLRRVAPRLVDSSETCASCGSASVVFPQVCFPCGDVYCFYCVNLEHIPFRCYKCKKLVTSFSLQNSSDNSLK